MITFDFGWKTVFALGGAAATVILVSKIKPADAKEAFIHLIDAPITRAHNLRVMCSFY